MMCMEKEYIEREALFEAVKEKSMTQFDWSEKVDLEEFKEVLNHIPAADVVSIRYGEWITHFEDGQNYYECSECGSESPIKSKWCPECGAKMNKNAARDKKNQKSTSCKYETLFEKYAFLCYDENKSVF